MAGRKLETVISINATANGFTKVGNTLTALGGTLDGLSLKLIEFGQDSLDVYKDYEKSLADAEVALATQYGRGTSELSKVMDQLDAAATEWAASSIFHTDDVGNAISEAAHAGWDLEEIMTGIPSAMKLAQAGSMDLSEAVNYIVKSTNAAGIEFNDTGDFIDKWAYAANRSATTIDEMGEAMLKMGSTMQFTGGESETLTMLAALADAGTVGTEAGTLLRNAMIRLVAPTDKASGALAELGATEEEIGEIADDAELEEMFAMLNDVNFSVYDDQGNLKNMVTLFGDLGDALAIMAGGYENIGSDETTNKLLSTIFPTRSITGALNLLRSAHDEWGGLYEDLENGAASGYGEYAALTQMDTYYGRLETFLSKVERLKQVVGEPLADQASSILGVAGGFIDNIANLDDGKLEALVSGLEVIAIAGPGLMTAGTAIRFIGYAMSGGFITQLGLAAVGLSAVAAALGHLEEQDFKDNFGTGDLDMGTLIDNLNGVTEAFQSSYSEIDTFKETLERAASSYQKTSSELATDLRTAMITGFTLTDADKEAFINQVDSMQTDLEDAIKANAGESISYFDLLGLDGDLGNLITDSMNDSLDEVGSASDALRSAMTEAFADGTVSEEEYLRIKEYTSALNKAMAEAQAEADQEESQIAYEMMLHKAQSASFDQIQEYTDQVNSQRNSTLGIEQDAYERARAEAINAYKNGNSTLSEEEFNAEIAELDAGFEARKAEIIQQYADLQTTLLDSAIRSSDFGSDYAKLESLAGYVLSGQSTSEQAIKGFGAENVDLSRMLSMMVEAQGGWDQIYSNLVSGTGDTDFLSSLYTMSYINGGGTLPQMSNLDGTVSGLLSDFFFGTTQSVGDYVGSLGSPEDYAAQASRYTTADAQAFLSDSLNSELSDLVSTLSGILAGGDSYTAGEWVNDTKLNNSSLYNSLETLANNLGQSYDLSGYAQASGIDTDGMYSNVLAAVGLLQDASAEEYKLNVDADTSSAEGKINALDGVEIKPFVTGNFSQFDAEVAARQNQTIHLNVSTGGGGNPGGHMSEFAEGGRATEASIFGEAGAEWAIPEEHSTRTADLLNAARAASGFTWPELLSMYGGFNANANSSPSTLVYSPTINANDVTGVTAALADDKNRLERWFREYKMREDMEVYA